MKRVLFVCTGNICRSPAAESVFNHLIQKQGLQNDIECDSAGTSCGSGGRPPDARMRAVGEGRGYEFLTRTRQVTNEDLTAYDIIAVMDESHVSYLRDFEDGKEFSAKVVRFWKLCTAEKLTEIPDPYFGGPENFDRVLNLIEEACHRLLDQVRNGNASVSSDHRSN